MRRQLLGWGALSVGIGAGTAGYVGHALPEFVELFQGFGAELPAATRLVLDWGYALWLMPALALAVLLAALLPPLTYATYRRSLVALVTIAAVTVVLGMLVVVVLYAPILSLGAPI